MCRATLSGVTSNQAPQQVTSHVWPNYFQVPASNLSFISIYTYMHIHATPLLCAQVWTNTVMDVYADDFLAVPQKWGRVGGSNVHVHDHTCTTDFT